MTEIEVKIKISSLPDLRKKLEELGAEIIKDRYFEDNTLYDFKHQELRQKKSALRLRKINKKCFLTFKGPPLKSRSFKIREEYETEVKNEKQTKKILKKIGLKATFTYSKFRTVFKFQRVKLFIDETPIGNFIEIEGKQSDIVKVARQLGYSRRDFIKKDYIQLLLEAQTEKTKEKKTNLSP
ncbi:MAG TPA: class IV adenylate cyclase [Candidatus Aminicenantes bacterium]|nr:class IV adenylate cyclase [Candidatus Aminicenantes bacterium]